MRTQLIRHRDFDIEGSWNCVYDYLEIRDGDTSNSTVLGRYCTFLYCTVLYWTVLCRYCGDMSTVPDTLLSSYNYLHITFVTDGSVQNRGFVVNYTTIEVGVGRGPLVLELQTKVHKDFTIIEKAPTRASPG